MDVTDAQIKHFWEKVTKVGDDDCWLWTGAKIHNGYGQCLVGKKLMVAHRFIYQFINQKVLPKDIYVCHKCDVRNCVNPKHLFEGTHQDNMDDGKAKKRFRGPKVGYRRVLVCKRGHAMTDDNIIIVNNRSRRCKTCNRMIARQSYMKRKQQNET